MDENTGSNIIIEDRVKLTATGVIDVDSFDNENVILATQLGTLIVKEQTFRSTSNVDVESL